MSHNLLHTIFRGQSFYYNRRVPQRLVEAFGCSAVRVSLGSELQEAEQLSQALTKRLDEIWAASTVMPIDVTVLLKSLRPKAMDLSECMHHYLGGRDINEQPVRLAVDALIQLGGNRSVESYTRADARLFIDELLSKGNKTGTVRRRLQALHAVVEFGYRELDLDKRNPFARLTIPSEGKDSLKRGVFTDEQLQQIYEEALGAGRDTWLALPILGETGARLAEIVGLRWEDVCLTTEAIRITPHALRRLKTRNSEREVPLVGAALEAMRALYRLSGDGPYVFPRWVREDRIVATHASNTLNKFIRSRAEGLTCHCFRHTMRDRLRNAGCSTELIDQIGGWSSQLGVGARYGHGYSLERKREGLQEVEVHSNIR